MNEEIIQRHKQEKKDLQSKIQSLKKSVTKGDKKKKKEVTEQIQQLEKELETRHKSELDALAQNVETEKITNENGDGIKENNVQDEEVNVPDLEETEKVQESEIKEVKATRAQRRRDKKLQEEREREKRIQEQAEKNKDSPKTVELNSIKNLLKDMGLELYDIRADGNCLYCAVNHQLEIKNLESYSVTKLRKLTANFMKENKDDFIPFMYEDSGEPVSESYFDDYCKQVASSKLWGGQLELKALSNILKCPIKVIQATGPPTVLGDDFNGPELILTYHRHMYRLGEHYNSTINVEPNNE